MDRLLGRIRSAPSILDALLLGDELRRAAASMPATGRTAELGRRALRDAIADRTDAPTAIVATHALAAISTPDAVEWAADLLDEQGWLAPHVAWGFGRRSAVPALVGPLVGVVASGRLAGMLAQRTLRSWSGDRTAAAMTVNALVDHLSRTEDARARSRLVETLGAIALHPDLWRAATDAAEPEEVRIAAVSALGGQRGGHTTLLVGLASGDGPLARAAEAALDDRRWRRASVPRTPGGVHLMQVHLGGRLDRLLLHSGEGDTGGVATLLVQLGDALASSSGTASVTTVGRGSWTDLRPSSAIASRHDVVSIPLARHEDTSFSGAWPAVLAAERALGRLVRSRPVSVMHLRMADVGTLAAARVAQRYGIPTVFTLAPDPHAVVAEMEASGEMNRARFGEADARGAISFRARLVLRLAEGAAQVAMLPRPALETRLRRLTGIDIDEARHRYHVIPEGIDPAPIDAAREAGSHAIPVSSALEALRSALVQRPARRGLPMVLSVGRLADVKGMARLVDAFTASDDLVERTNLVIVGGGLDDPTSEERAEIGRIDAILAARPMAAEAVILLGHRPHDEVLRLMAVADMGDPGWAAPDGAYACASRKEEFGLGIVEALGTGLAVVVPRIGGPASYVEDGRTGRIVDTMNPDALTAGIRDALALATAPGRADLARRMVRSRFAIEAMADSLLPVYTAATTSAGSLVA